MIGDNFNPDKNNAFYVTRTGPSSNNAGLGPDDAVVLFDADDQFESTVLVSSSGGQFNDFFRDPSGLVTRTQPPQITAGEGKDFLVSSMDANQLLKVQYIQFEESDFGAQYSPLIFPQDTSLADGFLTDPNKFTAPTHIALTGDGTNYLFVTDAAKDSVYQFTLTGLEGIQPPPASGEPRYQKPALEAAETGPQNSMNRLGWPIGTRSFMSAMRAMHGYCALSSPWISNDCREHLIAHSEQTFRLALVPRVFILLILR